MISGPVWCAPPCTMRWPTASIDAERRTTAGGPEAGKGRRRGPKRRRDGPPNAPPFSLTASKWLWHEPILIEMAAHQRRLHSLLHIVNGEFETGGPVLRVSTWRLTGRARGIPESADTLGGLNRIGGVGKGGLITSQPIRGEISGSPSLAQDLTHVADEGGSTAI